MTANGSSRYHISNTGWMDGAYGDNGGNTLTVALLDVEDSPAVDKALSGMATAFDQRGVQRDELPDIGA